MRRIGDIMADMGFNKDSSEETQKAFIKYLIKVAGKQAQPIDFQEDSKNKSEVREPVQLSFNLDEAS